MPADVARSSSSTRHSPAESPEYHGPVVQFPPPAPPNSDTSNATLSTAPTRGRRSQRRNSSAVLPPAGFDLCAAAHAAAPPAIDNSFAPGMQGTPYGSHAPSVPSRSSHHQRMSVPSRHSKLSSTSSSSGSSSLVATTRKLRANTFGNRFVDGVLALGVSEIVPLTTFIIANVLHYYKNRTSETLVPYKTPSWMRYVKSFTLAISSYRWLRVNGIIRPIPYDEGATPVAVTEGKRSLGAGRSAERHGSRSLHASHSGGSHRRSRGPATEHHQQQQPYCDEQASTEAEINNFVMQMVAQIARGLFRTRADGRGEDFDASWAVPRALAEDYHRSVFGRGAGLRGAEPHVLGGAAAIRALRSEGQVAGYHSRQYGGAPDTRLDFMLLGLALSEVQALLSRKAEEAGGLGSADSLENVGRIALATIIKIKRDEASPSLHPTPAPHIAAQCMDPPRIPTPYPGTAAAAPPSRYAPTAAPYGGPAPRRCAPARSDYHHATHAGVPPYISNH